MNNNIVRIPHQLSRRRFLARRGCGDGVALVGVHPRVGRRAHGSRAALRQKAMPKRMAVLFMANGINPDSRWTAEGAGDAMKLGDSLTPLEPYKAKINFIKGLFNKAATGVAHPPAR